MAERRNVKRTVQQWQERLTHTTRVWRDAGLTGEHRYQSDLMRGMRYYRGVQDNLYTGLGTEEKFVTANLVFRTMNTIEGQTAARAPKVTLFPTTKDAVAGRLAYQALINYYIRALNMKHEANQALRDSWYAPFGIVRHGFTPESEFTGARTSGEPQAISHPASHMPDTPWIARTPIWDTRIDCVSGDFRPSHARWAAFRTLVPKDEIERNPEQRGKDIQPTVRIEETSRDVNREKDKKRLYESEDYNELCEIWSIWDRVDRQWMQWSPGLNDRYVREPADWPIDYAELPYSIMATNWQSDDPFPVPIVSQLVPLQEEMNNIRTMMSVLARSLRRMAIVNAEALAEEDQSAIFDSFGPNLQEFFRTTGANPADVISQIQVGGFPAELLQYAALLEQDVRELTGQSRMDRGERINVESATEAGNVQAGSNMSKSRNTAAFEEFWTDIVRKFGHGLRTVMDAPRIIPILGPEDTYQLLLSQQSMGMDPFLEVDPNEIQGDYHYEIRVGTTQPSDEMREKANSVAWLELAQKYAGEMANMPQALADAAIAFGKDPAKALQTPEQILETGQLAQARNQQGAPAPEQPPQAAGGTGGVSPLALAASQQKGGQQ